MGMWGFKLYQNDTTMDIRDQFEELFREGKKTAREITDELTEEYECLMDDANEEALFWYALAETQWKFGVLLPDVKEKALSRIDNDCGIFKDMAIKKSEKTQRTKTLEALKERLLSPQPPEKKIVKRRIYKCEWKIGDVFAYQLESELARERGLYGRYFLIRKIDERSWHPGHIVPIVYVKLTNDSHLPSNEEEYNQLEYVQTWSSPYRRRFLPIDFRRPLEDIYEKSKIKYEVDEYGYLAHYRITLLNTSKKVIPKNLIYVGNFANATPPQKEFIPHEKIEIGVVFWKHFDETFETKMINFYCGYNLRELPIYKEGFDDSHMI